MLSGMPVLDHTQQQAAVDKIHQLMADGMSSGEAIALVAKEIREQYKDKEQSYARFEDADDEEEEELTDDDHGDEEDEHERHDYYDEEPDDYDGQK